jgi:hypothetical protein
VATGILIAARPTSDWVGAYAVIDRVLIEPDTVNPKTIQIWGVFALAQGVVMGDDGRPTIDLDAYYPARRGYLYYRTEGLDERGRPVLPSWADLRAVAGTGVPVGFGGRLPARMPADRVRRPSEKPVNPDVYNVGLGVVRLSPSGGGIITDVLGVPDPISPADGAQLPPGRVQLTTRNIRDTTARYVFEIEDARGVKEMSPEMRAGQGQTSWTPRLILREGQEYTWRVVATTGHWRGQPAISIFRARE